MTVGVSFFKKPTVVDVDVLVAKLGETKIHDLVCIIANYGIIYVTAVLVPGIPTHWWGCTNTIFNASDLSNDTYEYNSNYYS